VILWSNTLPLDHGGAQLSLYSEHTSNNNVHNYIYQPITFDLTSGTIITIDNQETTEKHDLRPKCPVHEIYSSATFCT
ncbi:hypothetical protein LSH36_108g04021, partial [Paralvinella palmiformis]